MRIVHISRFPSGDGAANAAYRLHRALLSLQVDSIMYAADIHNEALDPTVTLFQPPTDLPSRLRRRLRRMQLSRSLARYRSSRPPGYEAFSDDRSPHGADWLGQLPSGDVINIHAMYHFIDYRAFFATVPSRTPVVRTLHDMNFFTGGCHIDAECGKYAERCGACPQLGSSRAEDLSRAIWERKALALRNVGRDRLYIVAPSRWLANEARRSSLLRDFSVSVIPFGVDTRVFCPRDRGVARETLGISRDARVVLFVGEPITRPVKRFGMLAEALNGLLGVPNVLLVSAGSGRSEAELRVPYMNLGHIGNERLLSLIYSAADVLVLPSLLENLPLAVLEAMACGTPVVGSAVGGIPDMVRPGATGWLFPAHDVAALRASIRDALEDTAARRQIAANCRRVAVEEYSLELHARRYAEFYKTILDGRTPSLHGAPTEPGDRSAASIGSGVV